MPKLELYLQNIVEDTPFDNLPAKWQDFDFGRFSSDKTLFDFQQNGLQNALKALWLFYKEKKENKEQLFEQYQANGLSSNFDYDLTRERKAAGHLLEFDKDYPTTDSKIAFANFINRMSFWMATGSGKTLIIVKLINMLGSLMRQKEIPQNDILFLAHRDDLLEQFKNHVDQFNSFNFETRINLKSLRDYESIKRENALPFAKNEITVFYYRSDLISDEHKEKIVNFKNYDNNGKWYILLDEAHKGDREDSKRQVLYSILSRNGFLFNFSATFTDPRDYATCVFNFNLSKFIEEGYGKHIYVSSSEVTAFRDQDDFSKITKQKIVLKTLILLTYINKYFEKIRKQNKTLYHRPLLLTLVNSVDTKDADLKLFFSELEKVAKNEIRSDLLEKAKEELIKEFEENPLYEFEGINVLIDKASLKKIVYKDILKQIFNAKSSGNIEVLKIPSNRNEIIFKLQTSEKPFGLIKIGDISGWLKETLEGYEIIESFENESVFKRINHDDSEINILMGSRAFYEGWDSNRPNILLFVNIGIGSDAKKFVLQSVGRGVRIEPQKNKRKRVLELHNAKEIKDEIFNKIRNDIQILESLFVFGTNAENLKEIIKALKEEKQEQDLGTEFIINKDAEKRLLLIPIYRESEKIFAEEKEPQKYGISREDLALAKSMFNYLGEKVTLAKFECEVKVIKKATESFETAEQYFDFSEERSISEPDLLVDRILDYFSVRDQEFDKFKKLENEIVHFKRVKFSDGEKFNQIVSKIREVKELPEKEQELRKAFDSKQLSFDDMLKKAQALRDSQNFEYKNKKLKIKYIQNHYYIPLIVSENEKVDYLNHIIDVESEVRFIEQLEEYLQKDDNAFKQFDWWMFSKLDQTLDEVYIPYYNPKENDMARFKPDFIFWMQKGKNYTILFVDPKGTEHTDGYRKIDGYSRIFESGEKKESKAFAFNGFNVSAKLLLKPKRGIAEVPDNYRRYWFDNFGVFANKII
ncbi:MAG: Type III restriction protein res subunit [Candidatus Azambacteria bacterium GW2011_GWA1_42_19]|uniref:Type III restriction protein res subunit n=1 Tax=Candidatus Azambacteria bacterium GW2011_GWA1_42_19 TaxID=1618609 RepID=A0A0G1BH76_9BACT|nr:MAG: Type III restriction protein res subunit [Candidatus Azambacteria bacterium GW2011_GWA1_42_19]